MTGGRSGIELADLVREARVALTSAEVQSPEPDAVALLALVLDVAPGECRTAIARGDSVPTSFDLVRFRGLVARRAAREPLQHLTGRAAFRGIEVEVGPGVFVPRPETELIAGAAIDAARRAIAAGDPHPVVIDLCAGSGAIGLAVAAEVTEARVTLVELSGDALPYLERNVAAQTSRARGCVTVLRGDGRTTPAGSGSASVVVANPPYVPHGAVPRDPEVALHDPAIALYGLGPDGLEVPRGIVAAAARLLRPGGAFIMEHGEQQGAAVRDFLGDALVWIDVATHIDLTGRDRFVVATRG